MFEGQGNDLLAHVVGGEGEQGSAIRIKDFPKDRDRWVLLIEGMGSDPDLVMCPGVRTVTLRDVGIGMFVDSNVTIRL